MTTTPRIITPTLSKVHNEAYRHKCQRSDGSGDHCSHIAGVVIFIIWWMIKVAMMMMITFFARLAGGDVDNGQITKTFKIMVLRQTRT